MISNHYLILSAAWWWIWLQYKKYTPKNICYRRHFLTLSHFNVYCVNKRVDYELSFALMMFIQPFIRRLHLEFGCVYFRGFGITIRGISVTAGPEIDYQLLATCHLWTMMKSTEFAQKTSWYISTQFILGNLAIKTHFTLSAKKHMLLLRYQEPKNKTVDLLQTSWMGFFI